uniref:Uncharacterized protein n=1 Tax=Thermosporothrix sp. COM3 TaxID=2490863 RepID=A0A455SFY3_9CHLR|nr:hypothetical protein KTC_06000 [Thermosporothrix sp. COM3]
MEPPETFRLIAHPDGTFELVQQRSLRLSATMLTALKEMLTRIAHAPTCYQSYTENAFTLWYDGHSLHISDAALTLSIPLTRLLAALEKQESACCCHGNGHFSTAALRVILPFYHSDFKPSDCQ